MCFLSRQQRRFYNYEHKGEDFHKADKVAFIKKFLGPLSHSRETDFNGQHLHPPLQQMNL
jgi:hypothetical protein